METPEDQQKSLYPNMQLETHIYNFNPTLIN